MRWGNPYALLLIILIPLGIVAVGRTPLLKRRKARLFGPPPVEQLPQTVRQRLLFLIPFLYLTTALLSIVALARPQKSEESPPNEEEGMAIMMVIDRSGSMQESISRGSAVSRLEGVKELFKEFVLNRPNDMIGLISFARYADTVAPLTFSHTTLSQFTNTILPAKGEEDGTAIGDALALAAARLKGAELPEETEQAIILLTDGRNNVGRSLEEAVEIVKEWGIRVYTISLGVEARPGDSLFDIFNIGGTDTALLERVAYETEGASYVVTSSKELRKVYSEIDQLESRKLQDQITPPLYQELFRPLLWLSLSAFLLAVALESTWLRSLP